VKKEHKGMLYMLSCGIMWSISGLFIKLSPWNALVIAGVRSALAALVLLAYMRFKKMRLIINRRTLYISVIMLLVFLCFLPANKLASPANAITLQYTAPVYVLLFSALFYKQRIKGGDLLAVLITIAGIAVFFLDKLGTGSLLGNILGLASGVFLGAMYLLVGDISEETRISGIFIAQILTALVGIPLAFFYETPLNKVAIVSILILGFVQLGIPYILFSLANRDCPPLTCSILSLIEPLLNPVWVYLGLGEKPGRFALLGGVAVLITVTLWSVWRAKREALEQAAQSTPDEDALKVQAEPL